MYRYLFKTRLITSRFAAAVVFLASGVAMAQSAVTLTAGPTSTTLPDGQNVPMWGYICGATSDGGATPSRVSCTAANGAPQSGGWQPPLITVPGGQPLTITLINGLGFSTTGAANNVPTSLVVVGQLGGGLGDVTQRTTTPSPAHAPQGTTWPGTLGGIDTSATSITIANQGSGYTSAPTISFSGGGGSGAAATATVSGGKVTSISVTNPGAGYTTPPTISFVGGGGSGAAATVTSLSDFMSAGTPTFTPPAQADRVRSLATEVNVSDGPAGKILTWSNLRAGTYLIHSGTQPSIQHPMGLYGVLVVTEPDTSGTPPAHVAYGTTFDSAVPLLLSEIDPVQNRAVDTAVRTNGFSDTKVWNGRAGECGDPSAAAGVANTCYPPAVNYSPLYYLINGRSFDRTTPAASALAVPDSATQARVLLRLVNAGLRMHVPSVVGADLTLLAEDGNQLPGKARVQSEVFLAAGKTYDVTIQPKQNQATPGTYAPATYAVFDRALSLSTSNQRDGGMQLYINVAGGAASGAGSAASAAAATANDKTYYCVAGATLAVTDPARGVLAGATGANGAVLGTVSLGATDKLDFNSDGTFTYTSADGSTTCGGSFTFLVNGALTKTATISQCDALGQAAGCALAGPPVAGNIQFTSNVSSRYASPPPGVLAGVTSNPGGSALTAVGAGLNADGSFVAAGPGGACPATLSPPAPSAATCVQIPYQAKNAQGTLSNTASATVVFLPASNLAVNVKDAKNGVAVTDYRWIIEEDKTFWVDPKCQVNSTDPSVRPSSCPPLPVESQAYNFHTANMPVVAQGCVGPTSCEHGQTVGGAAAACDVGNGACRTDADQKVEVRPSAVHLDPAKRYFISVLPGDGVNPTIGGAGGPDANGKPFDIATACGPFDPTKPEWTAGDAGGVCGHAMGGAQVSPAQIASGGSIPINISLQQTPLPTAQISVFVFEDDNPLNGENDSGGGVDVLAPQEPGLGSFNIVLFDQAGGLGDNTGQPTYDQFNQPLSNALANKIDPITGFDACPITQRGDGLVGMIVTCPTYESDGKTKSPLAGQAIIKNLYPGLYEIQAFPGADRIARGEEWLQTNTLDGGKPHEAFIKPNEPGYFQEFGPGGFHVAIGFANPKIINDRKAGYCANVPGGCNSSLTVHVSNNHMSRTPDQRTYSSGDYAHYSFTQCYVSVAPADGEDFAFAKCSPDGTATFTGMPNGTFKIAVFDQWNDIMLDGLVGTVQVNGDTDLPFPVTQWRTNLFTRTFIDSNGDGVSNVDAAGNPLEPGLALASTNIRYRDGSFGFFNNTDLNGFAGFNEVFPFMNWLVVETTSTRFKTTGVHTVYDAGGAVDGTTGGGNSFIADHIANTLERASLPASLKMPGARYCDTADCATGDTFTGGSSGAVFPPQPWGSTQGWQGLLGQNSFIEFGVKPFADGENGGINGHVIYASTRPFDDPSLLLQLSWEPGVPRVRINLYRKTVDANGNEQLQLADTTTTTSWDDWAQGFRRDAAGNLLRDSAGNYIPNMNCPGQDATSPFFATLQGSKQWLDEKDPVTHGSVHTIANKSQFKCYDGWSQLNQIQPAPYDGIYKFPSVTAVDPVTGKPSMTNCTACTLRDTDGNPMLPAGKYVVEVIVPPGYELVKEEDKNILLGDVYVAPVTQQFAGFGNIFIMPDQATVNAQYNRNNPGGLNNTNNLGVTPRHEGDTGTVEAFWPCVGAERIVPDLNSLYPGAGQAAPFAGAKRRLCDRKEVLLTDQASALAKFYVFSSTHIAGHFTGTITNDFASEFDPFSPQFGEKFGPPNLPVAMRDFSGNEVARVYSDQWGIYNGLYFSSYGVNPPNPTGYVPQMSIACMNDPGPIADPSGAIDPATGQVKMITDPAYNPAYSDFCYETPFMPGFTAYMDTPVIPTQAFADGYNLPDSEYPDATPAISRVVSTAVAGPWVPTTGVVSSITVNTGGTYSSVPNVTFNNTGTGGSGAAATANLRVASIAVGNRGSGFTSAPAATVAGGAGQTFTATMRVDSVLLSSPGAGYIGRATANFGNGGTGGTGAAAANGSTTCNPNLAASCAGTFMSVTSIVPSAGGSGYATPPTVTISAPTGCAAGNLTPGCVQATATAILTGGAVTGFTITNAGAGYTARPTVSLSGGSGIGAGVANGNTTGAFLRVERVVLSANGSGYSSRPLVTFTGTLGATAGAAQAAAANNGATSGTFMSLNAVGVSGTMTTGYTGTAVTFNNAGTNGSGETATATLAVGSVTVTSGGTGYNTAPLVGFSSGTATATAQVSQTSQGSLTITALGDKVVQNPNFSGPNSKTAPFNQKTITRHYGFGARPATCPTAGACPNATIGGVAMTNVVAWSDTTITGDVPAGIPACAVQQRGTPAARCGELVITAANGKQSIDAITVTIGGSAPWIVTANDFLSNAGGTVTHPTKTTRDYGTNFGRLFFSPLQVAIDSADPGDLILVQPGVYRENLLMWKPVRLQGVGASSVTINADAHPAGKMDAWRRQTNCAFGLSLDGTTNLNNANYSGTDPNNSGYSCPAAMHQRVDRIPFEALIGWDASGNGNLAQVLQEPTLMGAYEGAGITVLGRGVRIPNNSTDFWGASATGGAGAFTDGSVYLTSNNADCTARAGVDGRDYGTSNFLCNPSRIDGLSIINSSQGGGGLFIHGWSHNLEVANTRISGNHGTLAGAINLGNGEIPDAFVNDGVSCGVTPAVMPCPPIPPGTATNAAIPFQFNTHVRIHHNMLYNNASIGDALFSGTPAGAGAITVSSGGDDYQIDHNWIAGNLSTGDGGGLQHLGLSFRGKINNNYILFNQSTNPTLPTNGGGVVIEGANLDRLLNGIECGSFTDQDCPPGLGEGTGPGLVIDANLILGNSAESGSGGGLRIQQVNGSELTIFPVTGANLLQAGWQQWYDVTVTNNIIANNVAGYDGGGVSLQDSLRVSFVNNTVVSNDTTASAGVLFKTLGAIYSASTPPGCTPTTDPTLPQNPNCLVDNAQHAQQPAGLVTMAHTPNLVAAMPANIICPPGFNYGNAGDGMLSRINGLCRTLSLPALTNDLLWQNRAFRVDIVGMGSGNQSQQNLISLTPLLNQVRTGDCSTGSASLPANFYWDVGVRTDDLASGAVAPGTLLTLNTSILSSTRGTTGSGNVVPGSSPVVAQFCNGARVPPENCTGVNGQTSQASCNGYNTPVGASESTSLVQVFQFNGIKPTATVDEGHNWLNLVFGPLTLNRTGVGLANSAPELMVASASVGATGGAYSIPGTSPAVNRGTNSGAPATDFFGNPRALGGNNPADIGAVEFQAGAGSTLITANPTPLSFANVVTGTGTTTRDLVLTNNGTTLFTLPAIGITPAAFTRVGTGSFAGLPANCGATLNPGASCTIRVQWAVPASVSSVNGSVTIAGVADSPVPINANAVAPTYAATVSPSPLAFGSWATGTTSDVRDLTITNTGNSPLTGLAHSALAAPFPEGAATGTALMQVGSVTVTSANGSYTNVATPTATFALPSCTPNGTTCVRAVGNVQMSSATVTDPARRVTGIGFGCAACTRGSGYTSSPSVTFSTGPATATTTLAVRAVAITNGAGHYDAAPSVTFSSGTAAATAAITSGAVSSVTVTAGGSYTAVPTVTFSSASTCGATLAPGASCEIAVMFSPTATGPQNGTVTITAGNGAVITPASVPLSGTGVQGRATVSITPNPQTITLTSVGISPLDPNNYTSLEVVTLKNTSATGGSQVAISGVTVTTDPGAIGGFSNGPLAGPDSCTGNSLAPGASCTVGVRYSVMPLSPRSATATATAVVAADGTISAVNVTDGASGYTYTPSVTFRDVVGTGAGATATAVVTSGVVTAINVTNPGRGYTTAPVVVIDAVVGATGTIQFIDNAQGSTQSGILWGVATP